MHLALIWQKWQFSRIYQEVAQAFDVLRSTHPDFFRLRHLPVSALLRICKVVQEAGLIFQGIYHLCNKPTLT